MVDLGPAVLVSDAPPAWDAIPDDRVDCANCARRSSPYCTVTNLTHAPLGLLHRCDDFRQRRG